MKFRGFYLTGMVLCFSLLCLPALTAQEPVPDSSAIEKKVDAMIAGLTLEQKLDLLGGEVIPNAAPMFLRAEPSVGFPRLKMSDASMGVNTFGPSTAYPASIALAATWDPALARRAGEAIGKDARARGIHFLLGPGVNIYRAPMNGRNFEYMGEDPYLAAHLTVPYIDGVQSQGVVATVKHFALNNSEYDRHNVSSDVDERTLRELYLPAFDAAVRLGHAGAVMDSYNLINGVHATQNEHLNVEILKHEWKFDGVLMSDWGGTYDSVGAANGGLDLEMGTGYYFTAKMLLPAVQSGKVTEATIDDKVRRIFRTAIRFGFLDRDQTDPGIPLLNEESRQVALDEARSSITLLKNERNLLPLNAEKVRTIAVFGPDAWPGATGGGGSSHTTPFVSDGLLTGLSSRFAGKIKVLYARGLPTVQELMDQTELSDIQKEEFANPDFKGTPVVTHVQHITGWKSEEWTAAAAERHSVRFTATFLPKKTGSYLFLVAAGGADSYKLKIDGKETLTQPSAEGQAPRSIEVPLTQDKPASIELDYWPDASYQRIGLGIRAADELVAPEVRKLAALADAAVVSAGFDTTTECEGYDRTFALPWGQDRLIQAVSAANRNTIVAVTAGGNVDMSAWLGSVPALLYDWYPGQEGGRALAEILLGERSPEGHLPASFEKSWQDNPVHDSYYPASDQTGKIRHVQYSEKLLVGYRYYTTMHKEPLFPFGFGLAYTTFSFSNLQVSPAAAPDENVTVTFNVTNTGQHEGATVAQLYVGDPSATVERPVKELKGFQKVRLFPGETKPVSISLDRRALAYWDTATSNWKVDPGRFVVYVGDSSANTALTRDFMVR